MRQILLVLFVALGLQGNAQMGWEVGGWAGVSHYFGDLNTDFDLTSPGPAFGLVARWNWNERLCLKFSANGGSVSGADSKSKNTYEQMRNLSFHTLVGEFATQFEFNFLPYVHGSRDEFFTPYLFAGFNVYHFNPKTEYQGNVVELRPLGTEGQFRGDEYYTTQLGMLAGGGIKFDLSYRWSINVEMGVRQLFTDYFDDVSGVYADAGEIQANRGTQGILAAALSDRSVELGVDPAIGQAGRQRGDNLDNDRYVMLGVGILYYFGDIRCPSFPENR